MGGSEIKGVIGVVNIELSENVMISNGGGGFPGGRLGFNFTRMCVCRKGKDMGPFTAPSE